MTKLSEIHCGTYRRETWELFGVNHGQWVRVGEYDAEHKAKDAFNNPTMRASYQDGLAWAHRVVVESRFICNASVPQFQLVMQMRGEDGEPGETIKTDYQDMGEAVKMHEAALAMPDCVTANLIDLSTGRTYQVVQK